MAQGHADSLTLLETRMARIEAMIFGESCLVDGATHTHDTAAASQSGEKTQTHNSNLYARAAQISLSLPSTQTFETLITQLDGLSIDSISSIRNGLNAPLSASAKKTLILANRNILRQLSQRGSKINALQPAVGGDAWKLARDEISKLADAEKNASELVHDIVSFSNRVDSLIENYDLTVTKASQKLVGFHDATTPRGC